MKVKMDKMKVKVKMEQKRGQLTDRIKQNSKKMLGYEIGVTELRLMPYIMYVMMNEQVIDPIKCNRDDRDVLQRWREAGHIKGGASGLDITKEFWNILCEITFLGYVDID